MLWWAHLSHREDMTHTRGSSLFCLRSHQQVTQVTRSCRICEKQAEYLEYHRKSWIFPPHASRWFQSEDDHSWDRTMETLIFISRYSWISESPRSTQGLDSLTSTYYRERRFHHCAWRSPSGSLTEYTTWDRYTHPHSWRTTVVWILYLTKTNILWTLGSRVTQASWEYDWSWYGLLLRWSTHSVLSWNERDITGSSQCHLQGASSLEEKSDLIHLFHEFCSEDKSLDLRDICSDLFRIICKSYILHFGSLLERDLGAFYNKLLGELHWVSRGEGISECIGDNDIWHNRLWLFDFLWVDLFQGVEIEDNKFIPIRN